MSANRIIYIDIDSLRPDHLGCYGYHRPTSPNIDALAHAGMRLTNFYASDTPCLPSRTAFFGGRFGMQSGVVNHGGTTADLRVQGKTRNFRSVAAESSLAETLRNAGWYTASISPFPHRHTAYQIWYGFHETYDTGRNGHEKAHEIYPSVERWLTQNKSREKWFLHVNFWDPHTPYDVPKEFGEPFKDHPAPAWLTQAVIDRHRASYGQHDAHFPHGRLDGSFPWPRGVATIKTPQDWKAWIDGYDAGVRYADLYVGKIIELLKAQGLYDQTAFVISADHGENQGELEVYGDHQTADEITNKVPLVMRWPGVTDAHAGKTLSGLRYNFDLGATFFELCGGKQPATWAGESFAAALQSGSDDGRPYLILSQGAWSCQRSVRFGEHLLIRTYHTGHKNFPRLMLFNLKHDPHEQHNLVELHPELVRQGLEILDKWIGEQLAQSGHADPLFETISEGGPLHAQESYDALLAALRKTGRAPHAEWLEKHGGAPR